MKFPKHSVPSGDRPVSIRIWKWMLQNAAEYDNATSLAEDAAHEADGDHDEWLDDSDHWIWGLAIEAVPST